MVDVVVAVLAVAADAVWMRNCVEPDAMHRGACKQFVGGGESTGTEPIMASVKAEYMDVGLISNWC